MRTFEARCLAAGATLTRPAGRLAPLAARRAAQGRDPAAPPHPHDVLLASRGLLVCFSFSKEVSLKYDT